MAYKRNMSLSITKPTILQSSLYLRDGKTTESVLKWFDDALVSLIPPGPQRQPLPIPADVYDIRPVYLANHSVSVLLAGVAEMVAFWSGRRPPAWSEEPPFFLEIPVYHAGRQSHLLASTPVAFRRRLLFCGNVLPSLASRLRGE